MKNGIRVFSCVLLLAMFFSCLNTACFAADNEPAEEPKYKETESKDITGEALAVINGILKDSVSVGVKRIEQNTQHAAVLMGDGTVRAFFCEDYDTVKDYGQCQVSSWENIQAISTDDKCTYGLTDKGTVVWAGVLPCDLGDASYSAEDTGWAKISSGKGYKDIICVNSMLFALRADGKVDIAFKPAADKYNNASGKIYDDIEALDNVIDLEKLGNGILAVLPSDGMALIDWFRIKCDGSTALKVHEGALCGVMSTGEYKRLYVPDYEDLSDACGFCKQFSAYWDFNLNPEAVTQIWRARSGVQGSWLFRSEDGHMGRIWNRPAPYPDFIAYFFGNSLEDWRDVEDAYVFSFVLPEGCTGDVENGEETEYGLPFRYLVDVTLGVKKNGECVADYNLTQPGHFYGELESQKAEKAIYLSKQ